MKKCFNNKDLILEPTKGIEKVLKYTFKGRALDIGAEEGKNSIFLAQNGFLVEALDKNEKGLKKCKEFAKKEKLPIRIITKNVKNFKSSIFVPLSLKILTIFIIQIYFLEIEEETQLCDILEDQKLSFIPGIF